MSYLKKHRSAELSTSSMADIAFLLLTFFLVSTQIQDDKGLTVLLPPYNQMPITEEVNARNLFKVQINSFNQFQIEDEPTESLSGLKEKIKAFILNNGRDGNLSDSPEKAIVSLKADRGTSHAAFIHCLDEIQRAYYEIYASLAGISVKQFRSLDLSIPEQRKIYEKGRSGIPMNISIAEPTKIN